MGLTRRGWGVLGVIVFSAAMSGLFGPRSLNAIVAPLVVVLLAAAVSVYRTEAPTFSRQPLGEGFVGETRDVTIHVDVDTPTAATVEDAVDPGLWPSTDRIETTLTDGQTLEYEVTLTRRGVHRVGGASVYVRDVLGLIEREVIDRTAETVTVYPPVFDLSVSARRDESLLEGAIRPHSREEFDRLREYQHGDRLRDVHWKSTAKRAVNEPIVKEFVSEDEFGSVHVVAEGATDEADAMATAAASVATHLLERSVAVELTLPNAHCSAGTGIAHHRTILQTLATATAGTLEERDRERGDVRIEANEDGTLVIVGDQSVPFDAISGTVQRRSLVTVERRDSSAVSEPLAGVIP